MTEASTGAGGRAPPLVVDLDLTLLRTDSLWEQFLALLFRRPWAAVLALGALGGGKARFKARLAKLVELEPETLPYRADLVAYLKAQKDDGRHLCLATAADLRVAAPVAKHLGLFDSIVASDGEENLKGPAKAARLAQLFPQGFTYAGDHAADLSVWSAAQAMVLAGAAPSVARRARALGKPVEAEFANPPRGFTVWRKALRLHQWAKNLLVFAPLLLAHLYREPRNDLLALAAFVAMGLVASATYLINDMADLAADRRHARKRNRPLASGALPIDQGAAAALALTLGGFGLAAAVSPALILGLAGYCALTLAYSFRLKRYALLDVVTLGLLYTLRIVIGAAVVGASLSVWLLTFSLFFFFSISLAKRYAEILAMASQHRSGAVVGRGYQTADGPTLLSLGVASSVASVLIVVLYLTEEAFPSGVYRHPDWLWLAPFVLMVWASRIWLLAGRGELDEDPVAFAIRDGFSWAAAAPLVVAFGLAVIR